MVGYRAASSAPFIAGKGEDNTETIFTTICAGKIPEGSRTVCAFTGHGLKDPDTAIKQSSGPLIKVKVELAEVKKAILGAMAG